MKESLFPAVASVIEKKELQADPEQRNHRQALSLESLKQIPESFRAIAHEVAELSKTWNPVEFYTADPESIKTEKAAFFESMAKGEDYTPEFTYSAVADVDLAAARATLIDLRERVRGEECPPEDRVLRLARIALLNKIKDDLATCDLVEGIQSKNDAKVHKGIRQKYGGLEPELIETAQEAYRKFTETDQPEQEPPQALLTDEEQAFLHKSSFDAEQIKDAFEWSLSQLGILGEGEDNFKVVIDPRATSIDVRDKSSQGPVIVIPPDRVVDGERLLGLINHEIGCHARQSINGVRLFQVGGGSLKIDDETLYEGLATREEDKFAREFFGKQEPGASPFYVLAIEKAESGASFQEVFTHIQEIQLHCALKLAPDQELPALQDIPPDSVKKAQEAAWRTTYRVMRGHTDMSNKEGFAMTKDAAYLRGSLLDQQLAQEGLGHLNEAAILASNGGLQALAEFDIRPDDLPIPNYDLAKEYWEHALKPRLITEQLSAE